MAIAVTLMLFNIKAAFYWLSRATDPCASFKHIIGIKPFA